MVDSNHELKATQATQLLSVIILTWMTVFWRHSLLESMTDIEHFVNDANLMRSEKNNCKQVLQFTVIYFLPLLP